MSHPTEPRCERGVYRLPWRSRRGRRIYVAIDRQGREVHRRLIHPRADGAAVADELRGLLELLDPN